MGASLLDAVLADTLDPAYAQAAAARAAQPAEKPVGRQGWSRRMRVQALVALTLAVAGLLVAVAYDQAAASAQGREKVRAALIDDIQRESDRSDQLSGQLDRLRTQVTGTRNKLLAASTVGQRALDELAGAEQGGAAVAVTGPGLLVTLANADPEANADPVGGTTAQDPRGRVRDGDLQQVVNALWASGAEAVSINGQRLGPTSAIRFAGEAVLVDFRPVANPYQVSAVGDPDTLSRRFLAIPEVQSLAVISKSFGLRFEFAKEDELKLPAASIPDIRFAQPEGREQPAPAPAPTPDPEPGG